VNAITLHAPYRGAFDWTAPIRFLSARAIDGVERVDGQTYERTVRIEASTGVLAVTHDPGRRSLAVTVTSGGVDGEQVLERIARMFDLDADLPAINACLARDAFMAPLVARRPAIRVAGGWDPFEIAIRSVIGQQVSVSRARQLNGVLVARCGSVLGLRYLFPTPEQLLAGDLRSLGMPGARVETLRTVAAAAIADPHLFARGASLDETIERLRRVRGIGEWTAHYIAMRACREPDAFPASDIGLLRGAVDVHGRRPTPAELTRRAEAWHPWRAYAAHHLWALDSTARDGVPAEALDATLQS
jgi:AraC family transcriptional regulator, regulatory protein of adaptative response / DNA-3-methyladenine glycosylase II